ncbi:hypothetical protein CEXT_143711 [Caerostris extrusa]|uniref:Uncharacterized protein n=1 Tax=Caerostris extrusa TaxID=172846 RepID=A0AAV4PMM4_CAEEX|nr:hypothetical protein CEXT_143711 [Caerostris extrusa]
MFDSLDAVVDGHNNYRNTVWILLRMFDSLDAVVDGHNNYRNTVWILLRMFDSLSMLLWMIIIIVEDCMNIIADARLARCS